MIENSPDKLSFNVAAEYASKISDYLNEFEHYWGNGNFPKATWSLNKANHQLSPYLNDEEDDLINKKFLSIQKKLRNPKKRIEVSEELQKLSRLIRIKLKERGLLIPTSDDPRFMFRKS